MSRRISARDALERVSSAHVRSRSLQGKAIETLVTWTDEIRREKGEVSPDSRRDFHQRYSAVVLGDKLRQLRMSAGLTQRNVANRLSLSQARISQIEKGYGEGDASLSLGQAFSFAEACGYNLQLRFSPRLKLLERIKKETAREQMLKAAKGPKRPRTVKKLDQSRVQPPSRKAS